MKPKAVATPWGRARLIEELPLQQRSGGKRFASLLQVLEDERGDRLVRFAYSTGGTARRGPVTLRARDLVRLGTALAEHPELSEALRPLTAPQAASGRARSRTASTSEARM